MQKRFEPQAMLVPKGWPDVLALLLLTTAVVLLFQTSPRRGDFWWSDAPRHAMDGAFYCDFLHDLPLRHAKQYAINYYVQYPALTIAFYPPLFAVVESVFFRVFGVTHSSAQLTVAFFYLFFAFGTYLLTRRWLDRASAFAVSLLLISLPEIAFWGRQVMLEIPACAFLIWSTYVLFQYLDQEAVWKLYLLVVLLGCGAYTKQTILFVVPVFAWALWDKKRWSLLRDGHFWGSVILFAVGLLPLAFLTLKFGRANLDSVVGGQWTEVAVFSLRGWLYYLRQFPSQLGWPVTVLAAVYLALICFRGKWREPVFRFFGAWLVVGYVFFSLIALKEARHTIFLSIPAAIFAVEGLRAILPDRFASYTGLAVGLFYFAQTIYAQPVPSVRGYQEAVDYVASHAPRDSVVLFSGNRDGSFIFDLRTREDRRDLSALRADKLLLRVAIKRELGIAEREVTEAQLPEMLNRFGVTYVVSEPSFWIDLSSMQRLQNVLHTTQFKRVATIPIVANVNHPDQELEIYQNLGPVNVGKERIQLDLPIIGVEVQGTLGGGKAKQ
jgi:hypothetical protein